MDESDTIQTAARERVDLLRQTAVELRDLDITIKDLEERLGLAKRQMRELQFETLPNMMDNIGMDRIGLPAKDNMPAYDLILEPYIHANISANWPPEKRAAAFAALEASGNGDLIKTQLRINLARGEHELAAAIVDFLRLQYQINPEVTETVHHQTLTAWLREQFENGKPVPDLETIGARVGRIAELKPRKD
jgi:hypothetical protein